MMGPSDIEYPGIFSFYVMVEYVKKEKKTRSKE